MSRRRRSKLAPRLPSSSRVRRDRSRCRRLHPRRLRRRRRRLRQVKRDRGLPAVVVAAAVAGDLVHDRWRLRLRPPLRPKHRRQKDPCQKHRPRKHPLRNQRLPQSHRLRLRLHPPAPARERWCWRSGCRDRARVLGSSGTTFIRFRAICFANFFSMTRRSSAFRIWCFPICDRC